MKKVVFACALLFVIGTVVGCSNDAPIAETTAKNKDGEVEGKEPTFVMVPAQSDPNKR